MCSPFRRVHIGLLILLLAVARSALGADLKDPTRPPSRRVVTEEALEGVKGRGRLTSIVISDDRRVAVIDGRLLGIGSRIGDARNRIIDVRNTPKTPRNIRSF